MGGPKKGASSMAILEQFLLISVFSAICLSCAASARGSSLSHNLHEAAGVLSKTTNYFSMGLTLDLISESESLPPAMTVFSPQDSAFSRMGQPPLSLLQLHFSPLSLSSHFLSSLPFGTEIPTAFQDRSLVVTSESDDGQVSLNGVRITKSPLYSDGPITIFGVGEFFNASFRSPVPAGGLRSPPDLRCVSSIRNGKLGLLMMRKMEINSFEKASEEMRSSGYAVMGSILGMQLLGIENPNTFLTVFAPTDMAIERDDYNFSHYPVMILQHAVPCRLLWEDLADFDNNKVIPTYYRGFGIQVTRSSSSSSSGSGKLLLNKVVSVTHPNLFKNEWLVVHGVGAVLGPKNRRSSQRGGPGSAQTSSEEENASSATQVIFGVLLISLAISLSFI